MKTTKTNRIGDIAMVLIAVMCVIVIISNLGIGPLSFKVVLSGSMSPAINTGDFAVIYKSNKPVEVGDVVVFVYGDAEIIHRIVEKSGDIYITKGDANEDADSNAISQSQIKGRYIAKLPLLGYVVIFAKSIILQIISAMRGVFL